MDTIAHITVLINISITGMITKRGFIGNNIPQIHNAIPTNHNMDVIIEYKSIKFNFKS